MNRDQRLLILVSDSNLRTQLFRSFERKGYSVITAQRIDEAKLLCSGDMVIDCAVIDESLPDGNGFEFAGHLHRMNPSIETICLTNETSMTHALKSSHFDSHFILRTSELSAILQLADQFLADHPRRHQVLNHRQTASRKASGQQIIGESESIRQVLDLVNRVADSDANILIFGESGTGKELIAKAIHAQSSRAQQPFVAINCGAIPAELLESELFGHIKGAFTGAIANRAGRFELADGGTIFLDEIGDLEASLQVKLLRVLQEKSFEPVGSTRTMSVDVRVIAATNVNLESAVEQGKFREDLFYRLNVIPISVPPLRERKTDIPLLVNHFVKIFNKKNRGISGFTTEALICLAQYAWPGNIRELENLVERLSILKGFGSVDLGDLPPKYRAGSKPNLKQASNAGSDLSHLTDIPDEGTDFNSAVDAYENSLILRALEKTGWNRNQAALLLRLNRTTLVEKIKKKGLKPPQGLENLQFANDYEPQQPRPTSSVESQNMDSYLPTHDSLINKTF
ncbi:MAG TPA: sigma-54 dependent transcriptional regulator [Pseudobdellovibrionaceae bacterium]|nr:sigma-54 dependent transcriptional regulator [Pseudobdellovibrionaceae bacterium]